MKKSNLIMIVMVVVLIIAGVIGASVISSQREQAGNSNEVVDGDDNGEEDADGSEPTQGTEVTPTATPTATPTSTATPTPTAKPTQKPTATPTPTAKPTQKPTATPKPKTTCTITIRCDTILDNMDKLTDGKEGLVPSNGYLLKKTTVEFEEGETVFDVLVRICKSKKIQLEYVYTPMYESYYIEGINNLYEFDCGGDSGWMYKVNGWFPNYGCSSYKLKNGDDIVWCYTCNGLGADVGA